MSGSPREVLRTSSGRTRLRILGVVALAALGTSSFAPSAAGHATSAAADAYLEDQVARSPLPGLAVAITHGEEVVHVGGYGTAGPGRAMTGHTPLRIASLSKAFTAAAVLQQVEEGNLDLDAPVRRYLPRFTLTDDEAAAGISVRHLLHHTSGLADRAFPDLWLLDERSPAERVASLAGASPSADPGAVFSYFNPNYEILARLVEVASGEGFDHYLRRHIFAPLGMSDTVSVTRVEHAASAAPGLAQGHVVAFGLPVARDEPEGYVAGSGGVVTTAADVAMWLLVHTKGGVVDGRRILDADSVELTHTPPTDVDSTYAMGWSTAMSGGQATLEHTGVFATTYGEQVLLPETGHGIVLLANANHAFNDVPRIRDGLVALLTGAPPPSTFLTHRRLVTLLVPLLIVGMVVRAQGFRRRHRWARQRAHGRPWLRWIGVGRLLAPVGLLVSLPTLMAAATGRVFPLRLLATALPELVAWLAVAGATGLTLVLGRVTALNTTRRES